MSHLRVGIAGLVLALSWQAPLVGDDRALAGQSSSQPSPVEFRIDWYTIASGGMIGAHGGGYRLSGTIGQYEATARLALSGGGWSLTGGFWVPASAERHNDEIFSDRFELPLPQM